MVSQTTGLKVLQISPYIPHVYSVCVCVCVNKEKAFVNVHGIFFLLHSARPWPRVLIDLLTALYITDGLL